MGDGVIIQVSNEEELDYIDDEDLEEGQIDDQIDELNKSHETTQLEFLRQPDDVDDEERSVILNSKNVDKRIVLPGTSQPYQTDVLLQQLLEQKIKQMTPEEIEQLLKDKGIEVSCIEKTKNQCGVMPPANKTLPLVKSPSDTTLYRPAFNLGENRDTSTGDFEIERPTQKIPINIIDKISNFVESMRIEHQKETPLPMNRDGRRPSSVLVAGLNEAKEKVDNAIVAAENFRAAIEPPKGRLNFFPQA